MQPPLTFKQVQLHMPVLIHSRRPTSFGVNTYTWYEKTVIHKGGQNTTGKRIATNGWVFFDWDYCGVYRDTPELRAELLLEGEQIL